MFREGNKARKEKPNRQLERIISGFFNASKKLPKENQAYRNFEKSLISANSQKTHVRPEDLQNVLQAYGIYMGYLKRNCGRGETLNHLKRARENLLKFYETKKQEQPLPLYSIPEAYQHQEETVGVY